MTKIEIINNIANHYNLDNRSVSIVRNTPELCLYTDHKDDHCGVGRYFKEEYKTTTFNGNGEAINSLAIEQSGKGELDFYLISEAQGYPLDFWEDIQNFHDRVEFWNLEGLSNKGKIYKQNLLEKYKE